MAKQGTQICWDIWQNAQCNAKQNTAEFVNKVVKSTMMILGHFNPPQIDQKKKNPPQRLKQVKISEGG